MPTLASSSDAVATTCLQELRIKDFALVSEEVVRFSPGLNVITGESGSGKSVLVRALLFLLPRCPSPLIPLLLHLAAFRLACQCPAVRMVAPSQTIPGMALFAQVDALGLITGSASPSECVRAPASCAVVEGTYALDARHSGAARILLEACGLPGRALPVPGRPCSIIVRREVRACDCLCPALTKAINRGPSASPTCRLGHASVITPTLPPTLSRQIVQAPTGSAGGTSTRSRCFVNGAATSLRVLRDLGGLLVDSNAQHSAMALRYVVSEPTCSCFKTVPKPVNPWVLGVVHQKYPAASVPNVCVLCSP